MNSTYISKNDFLEILELIEDRDYFMDNYQPIEIIGEQSNKNKLEILKKT